MTVSSLKSDSFNAALKALRANDRFAIGRRILSVVALGILVQELEPVAWRRLRSRLHHDGPEEIRTTLSELAGQVEREHERLVGVFTDVLVNDVLHSANLAEILVIANLTVAEVGLGVPRSEFGRWFHDQLDEITNVGSTVGNLSTSRAMAHLLTSLAKIEPGQSVYDPCCGLGGLLSHAWLHHQNLTIFGREAHPVSWALSALRLYLLGANAKVELGDSLARQSVEADRILCDPPFGPYPEHGSAQPTLFFSNSTGRRSYEGYFVGHCAFSMHPGGRAAVLVNQSFLGRRGVDEELRRGLTREGMIEGIVSIPAGFVPWISTDLAILVLTEQADRDPKIRMVDAGQLPQASKSRSRLDAGQVNGVLDAYNSANSSAAITVSARQIAQDGQYRPSQHFLPRYEQRALPELLHEAKMYQLQAADEARTIDGILVDLGLRDAGRPER